MHLTEVCLAERVHEGLAEKGKQAAPWAQAGYALELSLQTPGDSGRVSSLEGFGC